MPLLQKEKRYGHSATTTIKPIYDLIAAQNNCDSMPNAVLKPFLLVRFLCGFPKRKKTDQEAIDLYGLKRKVGSLEADQGTLETS